MHALSQSGGVTLGHGRDQVCLIGKGKGRRKSLNDNRDGSLKTGIADGVVDIGAVQPPAKNMHMVCPSIAPLRHVAGG